MTRLSLPPCRSFIIFARREQCAVIFRRGPTDWFQLILWKTETDEFQYGQWFRCRIYVRRSDLSPDGQKLIYFVCKKNAKTIKDTEYTYAWTAISKPPYLTALALWPKGDCWQGGGLFINNREVFLNHKPYQAIPHPKHLPKGLKVLPNPDAEGEDDPLYSMRLTRDGWQVHQKWQISFTGYRDGYKTEIPEIRVRLHPSKKFHIQMTRRIDKVTYRESFSVINSNDQILVDTRQADWVDWDKNGRLVILKEGKIFLGTENMKTESFDIKELVDFNSQKPEPMVAPEWATQW